METSDFREKSSELFKIVINPSLNRYMLVSPLCSVTWQTRQTRGATCPSLGGYTAMGCVSSQTNSSAGRDVIRYQQLRKVTDTHLGEAGGQVCCVAAGPSAERSGVLDERVWEGPRVSTPRKGPMEGHRCGGYESSAVRTAPLPCGVAPVPAHSGDTPRNGWPLAELVGARGEQQPKQSLCSSQR